MAGSTPHTERSPPGPVRVDPGFVERGLWLWLWLPTPTARLLCAGCLSLLPGTASVELRGQTLTIHLLDTSMPIDTMLEDLQRSVGGVFGVTPPT